MEYLHYNILKCVNVIILLYLVRRTTNFDVFSVETGKFLVWVPNK